MAQERVWMNEEGRRGSREVWVTGTLIPGASAGGGRGLMRGGAQCRQSAVLVDPGNSAAGIISVLLFLRF